MSAMSLWCQPCDHYFKAGTFPMDVRELRWLTKTTKCPKCGAGSKTLFLKPEPKPENTKPEEK